jgi:hypothetical protein
MIRIKTVDCCTFYDGFVSGNVITNEDKKFVCHMIGISRTHDARVYVFAEVKDLPSLDPYNDSVDRKIRRLIDQASDQTLWHGSIIKGRTIHRYNSNVHLNILALTLEKVLFTELE